MKKRHSKTSYQLSCFLWHPVANIVFTCKLFEILSIKYLLVSLGTLGTVRIVALRAEYNFEIHCEL